MAKAKKIENAERLRYIRVLERFSKSIVTYLFRAESISKEGYDKKIEKNLRYFERVPPATLYKGEYSDLEALVKRMIAYKHTETPIDTIKEDLLYRSNQIEKSINRRRYKKEKYNNTDDW